MPDIIITFDTLYELLRREKTRKELQKLDLDFFQRVREYLKEKKLILESQKSSDIFITERQKTEKQLQNIDSILEQLYEKRERKIIETAIIASRSKKISQELTINMLPEEKTFYNELLENINKNKDIIFYNLLNDTREKTKTLKSEKEQDSNILIRFLEPVPKFVGTNGFIHGPFEKEDIANLPAKTVSILINKKRAEKIQI